MTPRLTTELCQKLLYSDTIVKVKVIVENVVTCFYGTQCIRDSSETFASSSGFSWSCYRTT